jgi:uncharacterized protein (TIGR02145 family)
MGRLKCKIIGNQIWTAENLTREQYYDITGRAIPIKNDNWIGFDGAKCYSYETNFSIQKKQYLFDFRSVDSFRFINREDNFWRIPTHSDLDVLFNYIDKRSSTEYIHDEIAINLRGTYGWSINGSNKIGFNAIPNPILNEGCDFVESEISRWWLYNDRRGEFEGFGLYQEDVVAFCGAHENNAFAIRLVMDLRSPRIENNIIYI